MRSAVLGALALALLLLSRGDPVQAAQVLHFPYAAGLSVDIIQGYNGGTHSGVERYSLDLVRSDGKTSGSQVLAPAAGTVAFAQVPGQEHGCIGVAMSDSGDYHYMLCHIILDHVYGYGDRIQLGQSLGTVGAPGLVGNNGTSHIHMQLYILPGGQRTPMQFSPPGGLPLESTSMAADGSYNQWACSGNACHNLVSRLPSSASGLTASDGGGAVSSAATVSLSAALTVGAPAVVQGTGDCLRVRAQPSLATATLGCAPDGTVVFVSDGPKQADGYTWWYLRTLGWSVADYLRSTSAPASTAPRDQPGDSSPNGGPAADVGTSSLSIGATVRVAGTGDCLRLHDDAALDSNVVNCLTDGSGAVIRDGPRQADGHTWWRLDTGGWAVSDFLQAQ